MPHHRARFTARGRWQVARRVIEDGETFAQAAAWANVSTSTVWTWVQRWRQASVAERESLSCLAERSSRPRRSPAQVPAAEAERIRESSPRTWCRSAARLIVGKTSAAQAAWSSGISLLISLISDFSGSARHREIDSAER